MRDDDIPQFNKVLYVVCLIAIVVLWLDISVWRS
jgi:hypothetical protein